MSNYDRYPVVPITAEASLCSQGWAEIAPTLAGAVARESRTVFIVEIYPGVDAGPLIHALTAALRPGLVLKSEQAFLDAPALRQVLAGSLGDDPVFTRMLPWKIEVYFDPAKLQTLRSQLTASLCSVLIVGTGAAFVGGHVATNALVLVNRGRWELQAAQRAGRIGNLGLNNLGASPAELYKNAYFIDWRVGDRIRHELYGKADYFLDASDEEEPRMLAGDVLRTAVQTVVHRPFRVVPFFDPGPWGGQWLRRQFDLPENAKNYAWGFDCVPEENGVLLGFGQRVFHLPAIVLVHEEPVALLGEAVHARFGAEFPIRFDLLDTVEGGNLSLQVHPSADYIRQHFDMLYTQDESYYLLHSEPGARLYLGLRDGVDRDAMRAALEDANRGSAPFVATDFIAEWPVKTHDHVSIPAGTVHCSGAGNVVLEISATPYIFTFKLWDWDRLGLDGRPRPIHLEHGLANICWERTASWVRAELINPTAPVAEGPGWREERTGLHVSQFLETRRHWFTRTVPHQTDGNLQVMNLVAGQEVIVESPSGVFPPLNIHFGETFIVPANVGAYTITPVGDCVEPLGTMKAFVRPPL